MCVCLSLQPFLSDTSLYSCNNFEEAKTVLFNRHWWKLGVYIMAFTFMSVTKMHFFHCFLLWSPFFLDHDPAAACSMVAQLRGVGWG